MTRTNGIHPPPEAAAAPPDENAAILQALEAEAKRAGVSRLPRRGESRHAYLLAVARHKGVLAQDAHVSDPASTVKMMLSRAADDELYGNSPAGKALIAASAIHGRIDAELRGLGQQSPMSRRGIRVPVAHLVRELQDDPARAQRLSDAELALLTLYAGEDLVDAVERLRPAIKAAYGRVRAAAEAELERPIYDGALPPDPAPAAAPEAVPLGTGSRLTSKSLAPLAEHPRTPIISAADLQRSR